MTTWIKVMNSMPQNSKVMEAGDRAAWLFICGCCYANEHLTDGFIAEHILPAAAPGVKNPEKLAARLVTARLWHEVDGGWQIHGYTEVQRDAEEIRSRRAGDAQRKKDARSASRGSPHGQNADSGTDIVGSPEDVRDLDAGARRQKAEGRTESRTNISVVASVFMHWQQAMNKPDCRLTDDRRRRIETRLRSFPVEELLEAVDGAALDPFLMGQNERGREYNDFETIFKTDSKVEQLRDLARAGGPRPANGTQGKASAGDLIRKLNASEAA